jgi:hypothetical protein
MQCWNCDLQQGRSLHLDVSPHNHKKSLLTERQLQVHHFSCLGITPKCSSIMFVLFNSRILTKDFLCAKSKGEY